MRPSVLTSNEARRYIVVTRVPADVSREKPNPPGWQDIISFYPMTHLKVKFFNHLTLKKEIPVVGIWMESTNTTDNRSNDTIR